MPRLSAAVRFNAAGEGVELGGDFYDLFRARDGGWAALIGDVQGKGPDAAAVTALARHTLRAAAAYEQRPSGVLALLHRALREQAGEAASAPSPTPTCASSAAGACSSSPAAGTRCRSSSTRDGSVQPVGALGTLLGTDTDPLLTDVASSSTPATCSCSTPTASPRCAGAGARCSATAQLVELLGDCGGLPPDAVADRVEAAVMSRLGGPSARRHRDPGLIGPTPQPDAADALDPREESDG